MNLNSYKIKKVSVEQVDRVDPDWEKTTYNIYIKINAIIDCIDLDIACWKWKYYGINNIESNDINIT